MNKQIAYIKKINKDAIIPTKGSQLSAGYDLYATEDYVVKANDVQKIHTGLAITPPEGYFGAIFARSGLATKSNLRPANCVGVCDEDYTGEYIVPLYNDSNTDRYINKGERIAQLVFLPYITVEFEECDELAKTERGQGGFGSSGK